MQAATVGIVGRIVAASLEQFDAECPSAAVAPPLGALVITADGETPVYGAVTEVETAGVDPSRPIVPHGANDEDLATVLGNNPHLPLLLRTRFSARVIGYEANGELHHHLAESPAPLFARVQLCGGDRQRRFVADLAFVESLVREDAIGDEAAAAFIRRVSQSAANPAVFLLGAGRALVPLLGRQPERLAAILQHIRPARGQA